MTHYNCRPFGEIGKKTETAINRPLKMEIDSGAGLFVLQFSIFVDKIWNVKLHNQQKCLMLV